MNQLYYLQTKLGIILGIIERKIALKYLLVGNMMVLWKEMDLYGPRFVIFQDIDPKKAWRDTWNFLHKLFPVIHFRDLENHFMVNVLVM